jgi:carbonic anhydrase
MPQTRIRTADAAIKRILDDNTAFMATHPLEGFFDHFLGQQTPYATVVLCSDSRCQLEAFCNQPFNNIFEVANAGNRFQADVFSVSFGVKVLKTPILLIIGHTDCGAIKAAMCSHQHLDADLRSGLDGLHINHPHTDPNTAEPHPHTVMLNAIGNVNLQVAAALKSYQKQLEADAVCIIGGLFDMHNQLGGGNGKLHLFNINGQTDMATLRAHPVLLGVTAGQKAASLLDISRLSLTP